MRTSLITALGCNVRKANSGKEIKDMLYVGVSHGYLIDPNCDYESTKKWLENQKFDPNATFYESWNDIINKHGAEFVEDQLMHYATTYGTNFALGNGYVPNNNNFSSSICEICKELKYLPSYPAEEVYNRIEKMLTSSVAMSSELIDDIADFLLKDYLLWDISLLDRISNKEAQAIICKKIGKFPSDEFGILRCLVHSATGSALLIKSPEVLNQIKVFYSYDKLPELNNEQLSKLSRIFYRYKPIFLAMKEGGKYTINKIRRLAVKNHTPLKVGFWESLLERLESNPVETLELVKENVKELNNFKKVQLLMTTSERIQSIGKKGKMFVIRNGKQFVNVNYENNGNFVSLTKLYSIIDDSLVDSLKKKSCKIKLSENVKLTCPTSEKNFVGNYPFGTAVKLADDKNVIGIYWRNEWGANDLDLSYHSNDMKFNIGWCYHFKSDDNSVLYSGDMTNAEPEAAEAIYFKNSVSNGIFKVNRYCGSNTAKFRLFVAAGEEKLYEGGHNDNYESVMVDPNRIVFKADVDVGYGEKQVAIVNDGYLMLCNINSGNSRVANNEYCDIIVNQMQRKFKSFVDLKSTLERANFEFVEDDSADLDFVNLNKIDLINLFS